MRILLSAGAALLLAADSAPAQADPLLRLQLAVPARELYDGMGSILEVRRVYGSLAAGQHAEYSLLLAPGLYVIAGACDGDCRSVQLHVTADGGAVAEAPAEADHEAGVRLEVAAQTRYRVRVTVLECSEAACEWGFAVFVLDGPVGSRPGSARGARSRMNGRRVPVGG